MLEELLAERPWLLADGATATSYFAMGLPAGSAPEAWVFDHPDPVVELHRSFINVGADIILTNTFGANRLRLKLHGLESRVGEINRRAAELAAEVATEADRPILVAGSIGPTGELFTPLGELDAPSAIEAFVEQAQGLKEGGVDLLWFETMSAQEEIEAAMEAAAKVGLPFTVTASFDTGGRTMMGLHPVVVARIAQDAGAMAVGANCGIGAADLLVAISAITAAKADITLIAKANCGIPTVEGGATRYSGTPTLMADYARLAVDAGARIIGGCCGTSVGHLAAMRAALDAYEPGPPPDLSTITRRLGPLVSPPPAVDRPERRNRRRQS
jgi:methionine synthase I (cobalamin-dependent)